MKWVMQKDKNTADGWVVEAIGSEGEVYVTHFYGLWAEVRAREYADFKNAQEPPEVMPEQLAPRKPAWPKVEKFLTEDEIVDVLFERMKDAEGVQDFIAAESGLYHHTLGMAVRNEFWLWHPDNPHTMQGYVPELRNGVDYNPKHADNTSGRILDKLHDKVKAYHRNRITGRG